MIPSDSCLRHPLRSQGHVPAAHLDVLLHDVYLALFHHNYEHVNRRTVMARTVIQSYKQLSKLKQVISYLAKFGSSLAILPHHLAVKST